MEKITFGQDLPGFVYGPKAAPGVIVIQEWWGVNDLIKKHATTISDKGGFRVLIPDLYKGKIGVDMEEASHLMGHLDFVKATDEVKHAVEYLRSEGSTKVGVVGFCMGGALAFAAAQHAGVDAAVPFYGTPGDPKVCELEKIKVPVQGHFGKIDAFKGFADIETAQAAEKKLKEAGVPADFHYYDGAGHAFMNALFPEGIEKMQETPDKFPIPPPEVPTHALDTTLAFFKAHLH